MLDGLDKIDWAALEHAHGPAADVPGHLRGLLAPAAQDRRRALSALYDGICHQGARYEASAPAVPFLLELLRDPRTPDRAAIAGLVAGIAVGRHETWLPGGFPIVELRAATAADAEVAAYDAVRAGLPLLRELLAGGDPPVRAAAAFILAWFPEETRAGVAALTFAAADPSRSVAATALVALGLLGTGMPAALQDPKPEIRWGAAIALARVHGAQAGVAEELLRWVGGTRTAWPGIPFLGGDLAAYATLALRGLGHAVT